MQDQDSSMSTGHLDLLESLPVMILDLDGDGAVVFANKRAREALGLGTDTLELGTSIRDLLDVSNREAALAQIQELWSGEGDITSTWKLITRQGKVIQVDTNAISIHENSYPIRVRLYLHDGSAVGPARGAQAQLVGPIEARAALKEEREYTKALIQKSGLLVYIFDTKGNVVEINKKMEEVTGFNRRNCPSLDALLRGLYPDERYRAIVADVHKNMFKNQHLRETELKVSTRGNVTKHISWSTARLKNARGEVHGFIAAGTDVTEKKRLEHWAKLQASCLERISDGVIISDLRGDIIQWLGRSEDLLGYAANDVLGKPFTQFFPESDRRAVDKLIAENIDQAGQWQKEILLKGKSGISKTMAVEVVVVRNEGGQAIALVTLLHETGPSKAEVERASELERRVSDSTAQMEVFRARGDELENRLREEQSRAENYLARADAMASKNRSLEDEVARQAGGRAALEQAVNELSIFQLSLLGVGAVSIVTTDGGGYVTNWSKGAEEFTGSSMNEAMGARLHDQVFILDGYSWEEIVEKTTETGAFTDKVTLVQQDGTHKPIIIDITVLNDEAGNAIGLTEIAVEINEVAPEIVDLSDELYQARSQSLIGELTPGIIRHTTEELSNLEGSLKRLLEHDRLLHKAVELYRAEAPRTDIEDFARQVDLGRVLAENQVIGSQIEKDAGDINAVSRALRRFLPGSATELEVLSLNEVADTAIQLCRGTVTQSARIEKSYGEESTILGSANEATRAVLYLLLAAGHAFDNDSNDGFIHLSTTKEGDSIFLDIKHNGTPVGADIQDDLGNASALAQRPDTGNSAISLGLAWQIIESLDGKLSITERGGDEVYRLELPSNSADIALDVSEFEAPADGPLGKVLLVDSDAQNMGAYERFFAGRYDVATASNLEELKTVLRGKHGIGAVAITGYSADETLALYRQLQNSAGPLMDKTIFLLPTGLSHLDRQRIRKIGNPIMDRPLSLDNLESILRLLLNR